MQIHQMPSGSKGSKGGSADLYRRDSMASFDFDQDLYNVHGVALRRRPSTSEMITPEIKNKFLIFFNKENKGIRFLLRFIWGVLFLLGFLLYYLPKKYMVAPIQHAYFWIRDLYYSWHKQVCAVIEDLKKRILLKIPTMHSIDQLLKISQTKKYIFGVYNGYSLKSRRVFNRLTEFIKRKTSPCLRWIKSGQNFCKKFFAKIMQRKQSLASVFLKLEIQKNIPQINLARADFKAFSYKTLQQTTGFVNEKVVKVRSLFFFVIQHVVGFAYVFNLRARELFQEVVTDVRQTLASYDSSGEKKQKAF